MMNPKDRKRATPRLLMTLVILALLAVSAPAPLVNAADTAYTAEQIETWLEDTITGAVVTKTASPVVTLTPADDLMQVTSLSFQVRGVTVGLNELRITTPTGSTTVHVDGELNVFGKKPRFSCDLEMEYLASVGKLRVASVSNIVITGTYSPSLSAADLTTIKDTLNDILDASGLSVTSPGGDLTGIDVVLDGGVGKLQTTWTSGPSYLTAAELETKLDGMADTLAGKATGYLAAGEGDWNVDVVVNPDKSALEVDASFSAFGITAALSDFNILFDTLTATITDATVSVGSKTFTFSLEAEIGCSANVPSVAMVDLTIGDEYPGFQQVIADTEAAVLDAIDQAVASIVSDTGLTWPDATIASITVEGVTVVLHGAGDVTVELALKTGWNMVSVPVVPDDPAVSVVFAGSEAVYTWNPLTKSYLMPTQVEPERGYWVGVISDRTITVTGTPVTAWESQLYMGWNMTGSIHGSSVVVADLVDDPPASIQRAAIYIWNPTAKSYVAVSTVEPGKGYWTGTIQDCTLSIS